MAALSFTVFMFPMLVQASPSDMATSMTPEQRELFNQLSPGQRETTIKAFQAKGNVSPGTYQQEVTPPVTVMPKPRDLLKLSPLEDNEVREGKLPPESELEAMRQKLQPESEQEKLKQFGYDLFAGAPTTFAPATDIPVPTDYVIGPGDNIQIQIFGKDNVTHYLTVSRDGEISFPAIGPVSVAGMKFSELRENLMDRVTHQMRGNTANVTMGPLRSIRILVLGEAQQPGSYTISALSTLTNALLVSGGVQPIGSLRNIQLKRNGQILVTMDLYDLLMRGDTTSDVRLAPGDTIFIPTIGPTVSVGGAVYRPAIYELRGEKNVEDVIKLAGGTLPNAYLQGSQLERVHEGLDRIVVNLDLLTRKAMATLVRNGDLVRIYSVLKRFDETVSLVGHVYRPGQVQWHQGMRLTDLIRSLKDLLPRPETSYVVVRRDLPDRHVRALTVDLAQALAHPKSSDNIELKPLDEVRVFGLDEDRVALLAPLVAQLTQQTRVGKVVPIVTVEGVVRYPGTYPLTQGMRLTDIITAAGGPQRMTDASTVGWNQQSWGQQPWNQRSNTAGGWNQQQNSRGGWNQQQNLQGGWNQQQNPQGGWNQRPTSATDGSQRQMDMAAMAGGNQRPTDMNTAIDGNQRLTNAMIAAGGNQRPMDMITAPDGTQRPATAADGTQRPNTATDWTQRSSTATSGNRRLMDATTATGWSQRLVTGAGDVQFDTDLDFVVIRRRVDHEQRLEILSTSLREAVATPGSDADSLLHSRDVVHIFGLNEDRSTFLFPLMGEIRRQALSTEESPVVEVVGSVIKPGNYPLMRDMRISDLIQSAGNLSDAAYTLSAEITRHTVVKATSRETEHINVDLAAILNGNQAANLLLKAYDRLVIRSVPKWGEEEIVTVLGEVNFPGAYSLSYGETLSSLLRRVGGFTSNAFLKGAVFTREDLQKREQKNVDDMAHRMEADIAAAQLEQTGTGDSAKQQGFAIGQQLVQQLRNTKAVGRLVIDLPALVAGIDISGMKEKSYADLDVVLKNGDRLVVPRDIQEVSVIGEVHYPTSLLYQEGLDRDDYINKSGGFTQKASRKDSFIVQASGNVIANDTGGFLGWLPSIRGRTVQPGDTIVVPFDVERMQPIALWGEVAKMTYELAVSLATIKTLNVF